MDKNAIKLMVYELNDDKKLQIIFPDYYEVDNLVENQLLVGKDPLYPYSDTVDDFGSSHSIIVECHYTRPERIGLKEQRL